MFLDWPHQLSLGNYFGILIKSGSEFPQDFIRHDLMGVKLAEILTLLASLGKTQSGLKGWILSTQETCWSRYMINQLFKMPVS